MTKRIILAILIALTMCFFCACGQSTQSTDSANSNYGEFVFVEHDKLNDSDLNQYIMYGPNTMVMYTYVEGWECGGLTVMYNADGTLKTYSPEN